MENSYNNQSIPPDNNLVWAILCTVLCCLPLGIVSIIKSTSVNSLWEQGRYEEARKAAKEAKNYALWGAIIPFIGIILYFLFILVIMLFGMGSAAAGF